MDSLFNQQKWILQNGISQNSDGSTNNLADYYAWCRDFWVSSLYQQFFIYLAWGFLTSSMMYYLSYYSLAGPFDESGKILDFLNIGVIPLFVNIVSNHVICLGETKNHTWFSSFYYILSFSLFVSTIYLNNSLLSSQYFGL